MNKNIIIVIILGIIAGYLCGKLIYKNYDGIEYLNDDGNIYYIQYGVYTSNDAAMKNVLNLDTYIIEELDEKYYVYLGITTNYDTALKVQELYREKNIYTYIRNDYVTNSEILNKLEEYDEKINNSENILSVLKESLNNYQNLVIS